MGRGRGWDLLSQKRPIKLKISIFIHMRIRKRVCSGKYILICLGYLFIGKFGIHEFWTPPPPRPPPPPSFLQKFRIDSEWPITARNRIKFFSPLVTPPMDRARRRNFLLCLVRFAGAGVQKLVSGSECLAPSACSHLT